MKKTNILQKIHGPADVKGCSMDELKILSEEIRTGSYPACNGDRRPHGSNLGFVEATVALHYVFDSPRDKFVFDVSHQSYTHKILTGERKALQSRKSIMPSAATQRRLKASMISLKSVIHQHLFPWQQVLPRAEI